MIFRRLIVATSNHVVLLTRVMVMIVVGILVVVMVMVLLTGVCTTLHNEYCHYYITTMNTSLSTPTTIFGNGYGSCCRM